MRFLYPFLAGLVCACLAVAGTRTGARAETEVFPVGLLMAVSGPAADNNWAAICGARLAVVQLNGQGGILGRPVHMVMLDNASTPLGSRNAARRAVEAGVKAVIGASWSSHSLAAAPILQQAGIPMISPGSTHPDLTAMGDAIFRVCFTDEFQSRVMAEFARKTLKADTAAVLTLLEEDYSLALSRLFMEDFTALGGEIVFTDGYKVRDVDFTSQLDAIKQIQPDVVYVPGYSHDVGLITRQARTMGVDTLWLSGDGSLDSSNGYSDSAPLYASTHWNQNAKDEISQAFVLAYRKAYPDLSTVTADAALAYDAVMVLAQAVERAGSDDPGAIRQALASTKDFQGVTGTITLDSQGDPIRKKAYILYRNNGQHQLHSVVEP